MPKILYSSLLMLLIAVGSGAKSINWSRQDSRQSPAVKSKYVDPAVYDGLFVVVSGDWRFDRRELVISYVDSEIEQKPNDPGAATKPGFYPAPGKRFDFEQIEVVRKKVSFTTRTVDGVKYLFSGTSGMGPVKGMDPSTLVPFIKGTLTTLENGKIVKRETVKFGHAVIA